MFIQEADRDGKCLRQGDILEGIPFPVLEMKEISILGTMLPGEVKAPFPDITVAPREHRNVPHYFTPKL